MLWSSSSASNVQLILKDCMWTRTILPTPYNLKAICTGQTTLAHAPTLQNGDKGQLLLWGFPSLLQLPDQFLHLDDTLHLFERGLVPFPSEDAPVYQ